MSRVLPKLSAAFVSGIQSLNAKPATKAGRAWQLFNHATTLVSMVVLVLVIGMLSFEKATYSSVVIDEGVNLQQLPGDFSREKVAPQLLEKKVLRLTADNQDKSLAELAFDHYSVQASAVLIRIPQIIQAWQTASTANEWNAVQVQFLEAIQSAHDVQLNPLIYQMKQAAFIESFAKVVVEKDKLFPIYLSTEMALGQLKEE